MFGTRQRRWCLYLGLDKGDGVVVWDYTNEMVLLFVPFVRDETREEGNERRCDCLCYLELVMREYEIVNTSSEQYNIYIENPYYLLTKPIQSRDQNLYKLSHKP